MADPGPSAADPGRALGDHGRLARECLVAAARARGPVRLLASVGNRFGRAIVDDPALVRQSPASANDLLAEAAEHDVIVLIAHGSMRTAEDAALECLDAAGNADYLDVERLAANPDRLAGATVLLLSCETGRIGEAIAAPGGVAGTLMSAGARCVVAPLWSVHLDVAARLAEEVLAGLTRGEEPAIALTTLLGPGPSAGPVLGGPPPSAATRETIAALDRLAFVTWIG